MNKQEFINKLDAYLQEYKLPREAKKDVLDEYQSMIEEAVEAGKNEEDYIHKLGTVKEIAKGLKFMRRQERVKDSKLMAISPFISTILFFVLGFFFNAWHPGWLVFLFIPIMGVLTGTEPGDEGRIVGLTPFIATIAFMLMGTYMNLWHPGWLVFFIIPLTGLIFGKPGQFRLLGILSFIVFPAIYLIVEIMYPNQWNWVILTPLLFIGLINGLIQIKLSLVENKDEVRKVIIILASVVASLIIYFAWNLAFNMWHPTWIIFLSIPVVGLLLSGEKPGFVAFTPFISTALFILIGEYLNGYFWGWLVFLMIPIAGILMNEDEEEKSDKKVIVHVSTKKNIEDLYEDDIEL